MDNESELLDMSARLKNGDAFLPQLISKLQTHMKVRFFGGSKLHRMTITSFGFGQPSS